MSNPCLPFLGLAMFLFTVNPSLAADPKHSVVNETCAKACNDCQRMCDSCVTHCADLAAEGNMKGHLTTLKECQDCATCCTAAAQIVARGGPHSVLICECCA